MAHNIKFGKRDIIVPVYFLVYLQTVHKYFVTILAYSVLHNSNVQQHVQLFFVIFLIVTQFRHRLVFTILLNRNVMYHLQYKNINLWVRILERQ